MNLGIFTSCYGEDYAAHLPEWEASVAAMDPPPGDVVIIGDETALEATSAREAFILAPWYGSPRYRQGPAHDQAARWLQAAWAMHVGVDDLIVPSLVADMAPLEERADVIAVDVIRSRDGEHIDVRENRPTREKILTPTMGRQPLDACAAFRTTWLQRVRYRDWDGGVDVALWIDMACRGAEFAYTATPGVIYRLRPTSLYHRRSKEEIRAIRRRLNELRTDCT